jgi:serine/threonine-protein kinase
MVISTDPGAGERVLEDGTVTATLSKGLERYDVPKVTGMTEDEAQAAILDANLEFGRSVPKYHETVPEGIAIGSNPKAGSPLKRDSAVNLFVSLGPKPIKVQDWTGRDADKAEKAMEKAGLKVDTSEEYSDTVREGVVISQSPSTGELFKGDSVELVVSQGPELVEIPRVRAMGVEAARSRLESLGFEVKTEQTDGYLGLGFVYSVSPREGEEVPKGSTITLYLV